MSQVIKNRSEILFLYDLKDANPNGDPLDENKPRIDEETGINIVTDVRLKRTIRDYFINYKSYDGSADKDIFVKEIADEKGFIQDGKTRAKDFNENPDEVLKKCIDVRLFGAVIPIEKASITYTGPIQFKMGRSLHRVVIKHIKGTGAFASKPGSKQATFREEDILPYSLICFYGVINENAAKHTNLSEDDVNLLLEAMWNGTKNLISRSKVGQIPRFLCKVNYKEPNYHIGDLEKLIELKKEIEDEKLRDISEVKIDMTSLIKKFEENKDKILNIDYLLDDRVKFLYEDKDFKISDVKDKVGIEINLIRI
ncbi:MAG TPA: type I-B CRISPR-associated protein Cas7/Csh2 [Exilispira sp.]|nr:type I-B CRISPR-associated protein Cas7/Csh2 [Exilispira sp.]